MPRDGKAYAAAVIASMAAASKCMNANIINAAAQKKAPEASKASGA